jgi:8-oxo-dGTP diphosphatase
MSHLYKEIIKNVSVDCVIFGFEKFSLEVLLIKRARNPKKNYWALPGGFLKKGELIEDAAKRILNVTTGIDDIYLEEMAIFDEIDRFPLRRVFSVGYFALIRPEDYILSTGVDTTEVKWFNLNNLPDLPFDHSNILNTALNSLRNRVKYKPIGFELLPEKFTLPQLQLLYELILGKKLDKRNFRKKISKTNLINKQKEKDKNNKTRAAYLYKFDKHNYNELIKSGFIFEL